MKYPSLSILVPTVPSRLRTFYPVMMDNLVSQAKGRRDVEILGLFDNKTRSVGAKRNALLDLAQGDFLVFLDDDDRVHDNYVELVMTALRENPITDVVVYDIELTKNDGPPQLCQFDISNIQEHMEDGVYRAWASHTMVWRSSLAKSLKFADISFREDSPWSLELSKRATRQVRIDEVLYWYAFDTRTSETRRTRGRR